MPIYEYTCLDCNTSFELIRSIKDANAEIACVHCNSVHVRRNLSLFNATSSDRSITNTSSCSSCSGGTCSTCGSHR